MKSSVIGIVVSLALAVLIGLAGGSGSVQVSGIPLFMFCGLIAFLVHWIVFVPSYLYRTEHYFDLTGSITYLSVVCIAVIGNPERDSRALILALLIAVWAIRLGAFLFRRVRFVGKDDRFDTLKNSFHAFFMTWTLSGLWVFLTASAALAAICSEEGKPLGLLGGIGIFLWIFGFAFEWVADRQKSRFRLQPENQGRFISTGLWAWSRHPNYFGEITLWTGIALIAFPVLSGWQLVTLISPVFVWILLAKVSGIPLLEAKAEEKWGNDPTYRKYKDSTAALFPWPPGL